MRQTTKKGRIVIIAKTPAETSEVFSHASQSDPQFRKSVYCADAHQQQQSLLLCK